MDKVLKDIFRKNPYFKEINENSFIPQYSELIINGVAVSYTHLTLPTNSRV